MAATRGEGPVFDSTFWADFAARVLGSVAAIALVGLGVALLFPGGAMGEHMPAIPLGQAEPQRPLIGLLCFALAGVAATVVLLRGDGEGAEDESEPAWPAPLSREPAPVVAPAPLGPFPSGSAQHELYVVGGATQPPMAAPAPAPEMTPTLTDIGAAADPVPDAAPPVDTPPEVSPLPQEEPLILASPPQADSRPPVEVATAEVIQAPVPSVEVAPAPVEAAAPPAADFDARRAQLKASFDQAAALAAGLAASAGDDRQRALAAQDMGDIASASGGHEQAADAYDRALLHARDLSAAHPGALPVKAVLADVLVKIGDLNLAKGRLGAAGDALEEAVARRREVALVSGAEKPRLALATAVGKLAELRLARGDTAAAKALYEDSLADLKPLVAADTHYADLVYQARTALLKLKPAPHS